MLIYASSVTYQIDFSSTDIAVREVVLEVHLDLVVHLEDHHQVYLGPLNQAKVDPRDHPDLMSNCCELVGEGLLEHLDLQARQQSLEVEEEYCYCKWADYSGTRDTADIVDTGVPLPVGAVVEDCHCLFVGLGMSLD